MNEKSASIQLKLSKAKKLLTEVDVLLEYHFYITAINRLYYSCYHATKALLLTKDIIPRTHSGIISQLYKHFVKDGSFDSEQASFFSRLMQERIDDDYSDSMVVNTDEVKEFAEKSKSYIAYIELLLSETFPEE